MFNLFHLKYYNLYYSIDNSINMGTATPFFVGTTPPRLGTGRWVWVCLGMD